MPGPRRLDPNQAAPADLFDHLTPTRQEQTMTAKMRPVFYRLHAATLTPATTAPDLAGLLRAADAFPDRRRLSEGAVYVAAQRRWHLLTGAPWKDEGRADGDTTWTGSDHRPRIRLYDQPTPNGIRGEWRCSCGSSGTSADPAGGHAAHVASRRVTA